MILITVPLAYNEKKNVLYYIYYINQPVDLGREPRWAGPNTRGGGDGRIF